MLESTPQPATQPHTRKFLSIRREVESFQGRLALQVGTHTMLDSVGQRLRQRREARGQTLESVSRATRLSRAVLLALEEERFDEVGARVYLRGHLRAYAQHLELDADAVLERVEAQLQQLPVAAEAPLASALPQIAVPDYFRGEERPTRQLTPASAVMLVATALIVGVFAWSVQRKKQVQVAGAAAVTAPAAAAPTTVAPAATPTPSGGAAPAAAGVAPAPGAAPAATSPELATGPLAPAPGKRLALPPLPGRDEPRPLQR